MSKDLRTELENMTYEDTPDLWDRINKGIDGGLYMEGNEQYLPKESLKRKKPVIVKLLPYVGAVAAVLFCIVIFPKGSSVKKSADMAAAESNVMMVAAQSENAADAAGTYDASTDDMPVPAPEAPKDGINGNAIYMNDKSVNSTVEFSANRGEFAGVTAFKEETEEKSLLYRDVPKDFSDKSKVCTVLEMTVTDRGEVIYSLADRNEEVTYTVHLSHNLVSEYEGDLTELMKVGEIYTLRLGYLDDGTCIMNYVPLCVSE